MQKCEGIVIGSIDYKEKSKIVYLYTNLGHISIRVNNSKSIKGGNLAFTIASNVVSFVKTDQEFPLLKEYSLVKSYFSYTEDINKLDVLNKILNVVKQIPNEENHERIYPFVLKMIDSINNNDPLKVLSIFLIKMLNTFGIAPRLKSCVRCQNDKPAAFIVLDGGMVCESCINKTIESYDYYKLWYEYYYDKKEISEYTNFDYKKLMKDIKLYYNSYSGVKI